MIETDTVRFAAATQLFTKLRRSVGRTIDVVWMLKDPAYAQEILRLARAVRDSEIDHLVERFESARAAPPAPPVAAASPPPTIPDVSHAQEEEVNAHYIGHLR
jgi:hypothetical protein